MKRCPECRRDYYDDSLRYCLDDGSALLDGPGSVQGEEPPTAMLASGAESGQPAEKTRSTRALPPVVPIAIVGILVVAAIFFAIYYFQVKRPGANSESAKKITRLTTTGTVGSATISPDGKYVVYSAIDGSTKQSSLWLRHIVTSSVVEIVRSAGQGINFGQSTFSPDSNYIYFIRTERNAPGDLYVVPVLGGTPKKILDNVTRISFSPDGSRFTFTRHDPKGEDAVRIANADGSGEQVLSVRKHPDYYLPGPAWSPDGNTIACPVGGFEEGYYRSIAFIRVSDGTEERLPFHRWNNLDRVAWLSDGSGVITTADEKPTEPYQIWLVPYPTGDARLLTNDLSDYRNLSLTADSTALVASVQDSTSNLWVASIAQPSAGQQLTSSKQNGNFGVAWTPDGRIIYRSNESASDELWSISADGRDKRQLTNDGNSKGRYPCVTPDGRYIVFDSYRSGAIQLWRIDTDGSNLKMLTAGPGFSGDCSHSDRWVAYTTFGPGGFSIWKVSIDGGDPTQLISKYALVPSVSPDGKLIACYYVPEVSSVTKLAIFQVEGGEPVSQFDMLTNAGSGTPPVRWMADDRSIAYIATQAGVSNIWLQSMDGGPPKQMTDFTTGRIFWFDISRDGKQLAMSRGTLTSDVVLMKDFK